MKLFAVLVAALALLGGFAGALRAYSAAAPAHAAPARASVPHYPKAMPVKPGATFRWAPCQKPAVRKGRACVTEVTRTVTVPASLAPAVAVRATASPAHRTLRTRHPQPAAQATPTHHDDGGHQGGEHHAGGGHDD
jgi:hypothetical protein